MSGAAPECIATLAITPGDRAFRIVSLVSASAPLDPRRWVGLIDLSLIKAGERYAGTPALLGLAVTDSSLRRTIPGRESSSDGFAFVHAMPPSASGPINSVGENQAILAGIAIRRRVICDPEVSAVPGLGTLN